MAIATRAPFNFETFSKGPHPFKAWPRPTSPFRAITPPQHKSASPPLDKNIPVYTGKPYDYKNILVSIRILLDCGYLLKSRSYVTRWMDKKLTNKQENSASDFNAEFAKFRSKDFYLDFSCSINERVTKVDF